MRHSAAGVMLALAVLAPSVRAQDSARVDRVAALLSSLAHDSLEGRATGERGAWAAARILAAELERAGLRPAGDSGFFQRFPVAWQSVTLQSGQTRRRLVALDRFEALDSVPVENRAAFPAANVVGVLPGSDPRLGGEAVIVSAHYDHVGLRTPVNGDSIYNGADDNASGTVAVVEIARLLAGRRPGPRRTVIFLLVAGEERGGLGSGWYIGNPVVPLARTVADFNIEMIGRPDSLAGGAGRAWLTGFERSSMGALLSEAGIPVVPDPRPEQRFFERSDNVRFARRGIPAHTLSSFNLHADYHRPGDEVRLADPAHMAAVITSAARAVRVLADGPAPRWASGDPFGRIAR